MKLSACIIARNEETNLGVTVESVKGIVDEIVIVDTGSDDGTLEAAKVLTDKVFVHPRADEWRESPDTFEFDEARNYAIDQCTGDWILSIDCDETLNPKHLDTLRGILEQAPAEVSLLLPLIVMHDDQGVAYQQFLAERLFRNDPAIRFKGAMHNWLDTSCPRVDIAHIRIDHKRHMKPIDNRSARATQRMAMAERVFLNKIEGELEDARSHFYLAGTYFDGRRHDEAIEWFERYFTVSKWPEERYQAAILLAQLYMLKGREADAKQLLSAHLIDNPRRAEADLMLGELAEDDKDYEEAISWYRAASLKKLPTDPMFVEIAAHTWQPHAKLWQVYKKMGQVEKAIEHGELATELGCPKPGVFLKYKKDNTKYGLRMNALVDRGQMNFIQPLLEHWQYAGTVSDTADTFADCEDTVWCEWAGPECIKLTHQPKMARICVRVHGYEVHNGNIPLVNWDNVDDVIFVADYLRDMALTQCPAIVDKCNVHVVGGGVETAKFSIAEGKTGKRLCTAAYGNSKKNFGLALQIMAKLPAEYTLDIATQWQDDQHEMYFRHMRKELGLEGRVTLHEWQEDLNQFYADKDIYLSASIEESFCYALAEGMAAGLKPVIHDWISAKDWYREEWIFKTVDEAVMMIQETIRPEVYREYAVENLDVKRNIQRIMRIVTKPTVAVAGQPTQQYAFEFKLADSLESLGCKVDRNNPVVTILTGKNPVIEPWMDGGKIVLWHTEQVVGDDDHARGYRELIAPIVPRVDLVLTHHPGAVEWFKSVGAKGVEYLTCACASLPFRKLDVEKQFDVGFCGLLNDRRKAIIEELGKEFDVTTLSSYDHEQVNLFFNKCRVVLNLHCTDEPNLESRIGEALAVGAIVVTEPLPEGHPFDGKVQEPKNLAHGIRKALRKEDTNMPYDHSEWIDRNLSLDGQVEKLLEMVGV